MPCLRTHRLIREKCNRAFLISQGDCISIAIDVATGEIMEPKYECPYCGHENIYPKLFRNSSEEWEEWPDSWLEEV